MKEISLSFGTLAWSGPSGAMLCLGCLYEAGLWLGVLTAFYLTSVVRPLRGHAGLWLGVITCSLD